jgi:biopolymer transport protein ExbD
MAQFSTNKKAPFVDMTPMVDLGFLLITFFMLASTFSSKKVIEMLSPAPNPNGITTSAKCSKTLTVMLDEKNQIKYFTCPESGQADSIDYSSKGLRNIILKRQTEVAAQWGNKKDLVVLLKAMPKASYNQLIGAIDEMHITKTQFTIADIDDVDSSVFKMF